MIKGKTSTAALAAILVVVLLIIGSYLVLFKSVNSQNVKPASWWSVQSVDTVKYSRDLAREKENDASFNEEIERQVSLIADLGATHIAIGTPYDSEFVPFLRRWVSAARRHDLNIWYRGNLAGWEKWFGYDSITKEEHMRGIESFILQNPDLFRDGDIFTSCSECENGVLGDPRRTNKVGEYRNFLIEEYSIARDAFENISKNVRANYFSMNGDVAKLIMDKETTKKLGGVVVIDHYVGTPDKLVSDVAQIAKLSGGKIVLGETGVPIPDIHGNLSEQQQAAWLSEALEKLSKEDDLVGINYWTAFGGSTQLFDANSNMRQAGAILREFYSPKQFIGTVKNELGLPIANAEFSTQERSVISDSKGGFSLPYRENDLTVNISASGYKDKVYLAKESDDLIVYLEKENENFVFFVLKNIFKGLRSLQYFG